jgi:hypothetical protein
MYISFRKALYAIYRLVGSILCPIYLEAFDAVAKTGQGYSWGMSVSMANLALIGSVATRENRDCVTLLDVLASFGK